MPASKESSQARHRLLKFGRWPCNPPEGLCKEGIGHLILMWVPTWSPMISEIHKDPVFVGALHQAKDRLGKARACGCMIAMLQSHVQNQNLHLSESKAH